MKIPPIVQIILAAALAWALSHYMPVFQFDGIVAMAVSFVFLLVGVYLLAQALISFRRNKTTFNPVDLSKSQKLVVAGLYRVTRNPMYLGLASILISICLYLEELSAFLALPLFLLSMTEWQIKAEEKALMELFGDDYRAYMKKVRRWL